MAISRGSWPARRRGTTRIVVAVWIVFGACSRDVPVPTVPADPDTAVHAIRVSPSERTIGVLGTRFEVGASALTSSGELLYGSNVHSDRFSWSSSAPDVATVTPALCGSDARSCYMVTGLADGTATIRAESEGLSGEMAVTVRDRAGLAWSAASAPGIFVSSLAIGPHGTIYAGASDYTTQQSRWHALTPDGGVLWTLDLPLGGRSIPAIGSDGTLYVVSRGGVDGSSGSLRAVTPSGSVRWVLNDLAPIHSSPAIGPDGTVYVAADRHIYAVHPGGDIGWTYTTDSSVFAFSSPAIEQDGTIYVGGYDHQLHAVRADGSPAWTFRTDDIIKTSPVVGHDGTIYVGSDDGRLYAVRPDGTERWSVAVDSRGVQSSPSIGADGTIYVGGETVLAIDPGGSVLWRGPSMQGSPHTPILGADGRVYFSFNVGVAALDARGKLLWEFPWESSAVGFGAPAISIDGKIIATSYDRDTERGVLVAIEESNPTNGGRDASPWPTDRGDRANTGRAGGGR